MDSKSDSEPVQKADPDSMDLDTTAYWERYNLCVEDCLKEEIRKFEIGVEEVRKEFGHDPAYADYQQCMDHIVQRLKADMYTDLDSIPGFNKIISHSGYPWKTTRMVHGGVQQPRTTGSSSSSSSKPTRGNLLKRSGW
ncbi:hypothetical protein NPX13_g2012 [Xylaria arbuscula]|uniref:Uncharacterized protein n=1 Tax=Xylaria arbuscula TaxID=114810 RepID=A0A9W8NL03_9PEZI|nr:hypothetical protein NPX13_g2012 [Xylaria arbuscula]